MDLLTGDFDKISVPTTHEEKPITLSKSGSALARRPAPPPPVGNQEDSFVPVDGLTPGAVEALFREADIDGDGRVADQEARTFFLRTGLSSTDLSTIWRSVKPAGVSAAHGKGLTRRRFSQALRLVALAQSGEGLSTLESIHAAMVPSTWAAQQRGQLPPPRFDAAETYATNMRGYAAEPPPQQQPQNAEEASMVTGLEFLGIDMGAMSLDQRERTFAGQPSLPAPDEMATIDEAEPRTYVDDEGGVDAKSSAGGDDAQFVDVPLQGQGFLSGAMMPGGVDAASSLQEAQFGGSGRSVSSTSSALSSRSLSRNKAMCRTLRSLQSPVVSTSLKPPLVYEIRYPPLNPSTCAKLTFLQAGNGSLFAGPSAHGGLLQWANPDGHVQEPHKGGIGPARHHTKMAIVERLAADFTATHLVNHEYHHHRRASDEDDDAAPCKETDVAPRGVAASGLSGMVGSVEASTSDGGGGDGSTATYPSAPTSSGKFVACATIDEPRGVLWVGDREGWVASYDLSGPSGALLVPRKARLTSWQAHRVGSVTVLCAAPNGELWTGSSRGALRVWRPEISSCSSLQFQNKSRDKGHDGSDHGFVSVGGVKERSRNARSGSLPPRPRELRRFGGERAHSGPVLAIVASADGQLVWSASARHIVLWDAGSGACLGTLQRQGGIAAISSAGFASNASSNYNYNGGSATPMASFPNAVAGAALGGIAGASNAINTSFTEGTLDVRIHPSRGLEIDGVTGAVLSRPSAADSYRYELQQESWASQSDRGVAEFAERLSEGAGRAAKFVSKLGAKLAGIGGGTGAGSSGGTSSSSAAAANPGASTVGRDGGAGMTYVDLPTVSIQAPGEEECPPASQQQQQFGEGTLGAWIPPLGGDVVALVATPDNVVWVGLRNGRVERYTSAGRFLSARDFGGGRVRTLAAVGSHVWVGFTNGMLSVLGADGSGLRAFLAHHAGIISIVQAGGRTYTLAADGSINGWSAAIPSSLDAAALDACRAEASETYTRESLKALAVTWNCASARPDRGSAFFRWMHEHGYDKSLAFVALQEVEMGGTSVALAAARDAINSKLAERGNANAQNWSGAILFALGGSRQWHQVAMRQLSGMVVLVFARANLKNHIGEIATASVACGVLGVGGNKGGVAVEFTLYRQKFAVVCSHFAAHQHAVEARNANYAAIARYLTFQRNKAWVLADADDASLGDSTETIPGAVGQQHVHDASRPSSAFVPAQDEASLLPPASSSSSENGDDERQQPRVSSSGFDADAGRGAVGGAYGTGAVENTGLTMPTRIFDEDADADDFQSIDENFLATMVTPRSISATSASSRSTFVDDTHGLLHKSSSTPTAAAAAAASPLSKHTGGGLANASANPPVGTTVPTQTEAEVLQGEGLRAVSALIWMGDFNYRIDGQYEQVKHLAVTGSFAPLRACDQLKRQMMAGKAFRGLREGPLTFPPTYKFDKGVAHAAAYDSSEKQRVPAWCDRILFRGSVPFPLPKSPDDDAYRHLSLPKESEVRVVAAEYGSWGDVYDSDHRPVYAVLDISLPVTDAAKKRQLTADLMEAHAPADVQGRGAPEATLSAGAVRLHPTHMPVQMVLLSNPGSSPLHYCVVPGLPPGIEGGGLGVEVRPVRGIVSPGTSGEIFLHAAAGVGGAGGAFSGALAASSYASAPVEVPFRIMVGRQYSGGGEKEKVKELEFVAVVLPEFTNLEAF